MYETTARNIKEVAGCPAGHSVDVLSTPEEADAYGMKDAMTPERPILVRHTEKKPQGEYQAIVPTDVQTWNSIYNGDDRAVENIKEMGELFHHPEHYTEQV